MCACQQTKLVKCFPSTFLLTGFKYRDEIELQVSGNHISTTTSTFIN